MFSGSTRRNAVALALAFIFAILYVQRASATSNRELERYANVVRPLVITPHVTVVVTDNKTTRIRVLYDSLDHFCQGTESIGLMDTTDAEIDHDELRVPGAFQVKAGTRGRITEGYYVDCERSGVGNTTTNAVRVKLADGRSGWIDISELDPQQ